MRPHATPYAEYEPQVDEIRLLYRSQNDEGPAGAGPSLDPCCVLRRRCQCGLRVDKAPPERRVVVRDPEIAGAPLNDRLDLIRRERRVLPEDQRGETGDMWCRH